ncbi:MAG: hypothetical protein ATN35_08620 [Epulopiscium sp. Nele67-Bin004]|nr:MAG: hypothetical protein ATN35_08620 [Epulopiscium sp. Nele67-Bin004]
MNNLILIYLLINFLQNFTFFHIVSRVLNDKPNIKLQLILSSFNVIIAIIYLNIPPIIGSYMFRILTYCILTIIFFKGKYLPKIALALVIIVNTLCIETMVVATFSLALQVSMCTIMTFGNLFLYSQIITSGICVLLTLIILKLVPEDCWTLSRDNDHKNIIFLALQSICIVSILASSTVYTVSHFIYEEIIQQLIQGVSWLFVEYVGVFMLIGFETLERHKKVLSEELFIKNFYKNILHDKCELIMQINCTTDEIIECRVKNKVNSRAVGKSYTEVISAIICNQMHPDDRANTLIVSDINYMIKEFDNQVTKYNFEYRLAGRRNSLYKWFNVDVCMTRNFELNQITAVLVVENIQKEKDLLFKSERDALSELYNKATTQHLIQKYLHESGILFMIDLDHFKTLNDNLGHAMGDKAIKDISGELTSIFKDTDIIGRVGGDEFMVFVRNPSNKFDLQAIAKELSQRVKKTYCINDEAVTISASIGIVYANNDITDFKVLYDLADKAMYMSKAKGKNTFTVYNRNG